MYQSMVCVYIAIVEQFIEIEIEISVEVKIVEIEKQNSC